MSNTSNSDIIYSTLPGVPESQEGIITITPNNPTSDDPLHIRHLKQIAVKSFNERLKSQASQHSKKSGQHKLHFGRSKMSLCSGSPPARTESSVSSAASISSLTTHSMGSGESGSFVDKRPYLYRDNTFVLVCCLAIVGYGVFWVIQAIFIEELMLITGVTLKEMGYLCAAVRIGKIVGHLCFVPLTAIFPHNHNKILAANTAIYACLIATVPFITHPLLLGFNWLLLGICFGMSDSVQVFIIQLYGGSTGERQVLNNCIYAVYSTSGFLASMILNLIKEQVSGTKPQLFWSFSINAGLTIITIIPIVTIMFIRHHKNVCVERDPSIQAPPKFKGFRHYYLSFTLVSISAFTVVFLTSSVWVYGLLYARNARADLTSDQVETCVGVFYAALMGVRIGSVFIVKYYKNTTVVLMTCHGILSVAAVSTILLQDTLYEGVIMTMLFYGFGVGLYHQSLLNWLTDHIVITPKTSLPFFIASSSGIVFAPIVVPHILSNERGEVIPQRFIWLTFLLTVSIISSSSLLLIVEKMKDEDIDKVTDIEILPTILYPYAMSRTSTRPSSADGVDEGGEDEAPWSRLSKLSTFTHTMDPVLSFVSSLN